MPPQRREGASSKIDQTFAPDQKREREREGKCFFILFYPGKVSPANSNGKNLKKQFISHKLIYLFIKIYTYFHLRRRVDLHLGLEPPFSHVVLAHLKK